MASNKQRKTGIGDVVTNRKANHDYTILDTLEAGLVLRGSEVKSLRAGKGNLNEAFARIEGDEVWLYGSDIQSYEFANIYDHTPKTKRKLLLHRQEIRKLHSSVTIAGRSLIALKMYWKNRRIKVLLGIGVGKQHQDKRETLKRAVQKREMDQAMKAARRAG
ncbi:SsrA-binding protein [Verrucomicrobia bacterium LW23]|nr:SsrA-binding protein [Verrucomicrobia bacterium LW23]